MIMAAWFIGAITMLCMMREWWFLMLLTFFGVLILHARHEEKK